MLGRKYPTISIDLCFWKSAKGLPEDVYEQLADDENVQGLTPSQDVLNFRTELLHKWSVLADAISPWGPDLSPRLPWGNQHLLSYFVLLNFEDEGALHLLEDVVADARRHGLQGYDPQEERKI